MRQYGNPLALPSDQTALIFARRPGARDCGPSRLKATSMTTHQNAAVLPRTAGNLTVLLAALTAMGPLSIDMYLPAMPTLAAEFRTAPSGAQLTLSLFFVGFALGQLVHGPLSDRFGRKRPLLFALGLFIAASLLCSMAPSIDALIGLRFVQALGACSGTVLARAVVSDIYGKDQSARVMSHMMLAMAVAPLLAPFVGGYLLIWTGWRAIFVLLACIGFVLLLLAWRALPESLSPERRTRLSPGQMVRGYGSLLRDRGYLGYVLSGACVLAGMFAYISGSPFVFIDLFGIAPQHYGFLFGLNVVGLMTGALLNGRLVGRLGSDRILKIGVRAAALSGSALFLSALLGFGGIPGLLVPLFCYTTCISFVGPNAMAGALAPRPHIAGTGSALAGALQFGVGAVAGAAVGLLHNGTALPMAGTIAVTGLLSFTFHRWLVSGRAAA